MDDLKDFYKKIFNLEYLIKYGYYDLNVKHISDNENQTTNELENEIKNESQVYLETDNFYSRYFNMDDIFEFLEDKNLNYLVDDDDKVVYDQNSILKQKTWTDPIIFTIPKKNDITIRRTYKMPNLYSYLRLAHYINIQQDEFITLFSENEQSTSKYFKQLEFNEFGITDKISTRLQSYGNHIINLDLSNFYPSLYTHSLAWVDLGKQKAKKDHESGIGNNLDELIQAEQYGETHGVPTGNFLTRIVAEYFLCKIDVELKNEGFSYVRYVDDFKFPFNREIDKEQFLTRVHEKSNEYNITLNENKTIIESYPINNKLNKDDIFMYFDNFTSDKIGKWIDKVYNYINFCIAEESKGNKGAIKTMYKGVIYTLKNTPLISEIITQKDDKSDYNLFKHFLDISLKDSKLTSRFIEFTEKLIEYGVDSNILKNLVKEYFEENHNDIKVKINNCIKNKYNQEVYQILLYTLVFEIYDILNVEQLLYLIGEEDEDSDGSILLNLIDITNDDFTIVLAMTIYLKIIIDNYFITENYQTYNEYMNRFFAKTDSLFVGSYQSYLRQEDIQNNPINNREDSRMVEKFWFVRYYFYRLVKNYSSFKEARNRYLHNNLVEQDNRLGYKTQLNWNYVKANFDVDKFYDLMLNEGVKLFHYEFENYS